MTRRSLVPSALLTLFFFLALDACWLTLMGPRLYQPTLGHLIAPQVNWLAALLFYAIYLGGLMYFAVSAAVHLRRPRIALCRGALLGLVAYATYDLTNQATMRDWPWLVTLADIVWGTFVSGFSAWAAARLTCRRVTRAAVR
jgi:uncharacterized membrane protein